MPKYKNRSGDSGVRSYAIESDAIQVRFVDGPRYTYPESLVGKRKLAAMEKRAIAGKGLATMIATDPVVREGYRTRGAKG